MVLPTPGLPPTRSTSPGRMPPDSTSSRGLNPVAHEESYGPSIVASCSSARVVSAVRISPRRARPLVVTVVELMGQPWAEVLVDADRRRAQDHDEQAGHDAEHHGEQDLDRQLHRLLLGVLPPLQPQLGRLHLHRLSDGHAELLGLGQGHDELPELGELHAVGHGEERVPAPHAGPDVLAHAGELGGERSLAGDGQAGDGGVETEAGLDGDRELIDGVGQLPPDDLLALVGLDAQQDVRERRSRRHRSPAPGARPRRSGPPSGGGGRGPRRRWRTAP